MVHRVFIATDDNLSTIHVQFNVSLLCNLINWVQMLRLRNAVTATMQRKNNELQTKLKHI